MIEEGFNDDCLLMVCTRSSDEYNRKIMRTFQNIKYLYLDAETYENAKPPGEVLIQNFTRFYIGIRSTGPTTMKLDDILMMNSNDVVINFSELTEKDANRFLKLWIRGSAKLEYFPLRFANERNVDRDTVFKGIKFKEISLEVKRFFDGVADPIEGGIDIVRRDGIRGTIKFKGGNMEFYVWHDYCKMEK